MTRDLLFEIGVEELPGGYVPPALEQLESLRDLVESQRQVAGAAEEPIERGGRELEEHRRPAQEPPGQTRQLH